MIKGSSKACFGIRAPLPGEDSSPPMTFNAGCPRGFIRYVTGATRVLVPDTDIHVLFFKVHISCDGVTSSLL